MRLVAGWPLLVLAAGLVSVGVYAGRNQAVAIPVALLALLVLGLLLVGPTRRTSRATGPYGPSRPPEVPSAFRAALHGGRSARREVVAMLDQLERKGSRPSLPQTAAAEYERVRVLPRSGFRSYVLSRLEAIERGYP